MTDFLLTAILNRVDDENKTENKINRKFRSGFPKVVSLIIWAWKKKHICLIAKQALKSLVIDHELHAATS